VEGDRVAVVQKTHLALAHEVGAAGMLEAVLDGEPRVQALDVPAWTGHKAANNAALLAHSLAARATRPTEMARTARAAMRGSRRAVAAVGRRSRASVGMRSNLRYEIVRADGASEADVNAVVRGLGPRIAITFETLPAPRYFLGARLLEAFPSAAPAGVAPAVSVLSYDGRLAIGITGDRATNGDLCAFADVLDRAFGEPGVAAG
jgi:hypothetical protein